MVSHRIKEIEERFKEVAGIDCDLSSFPLDNNLDSQTETRKKQSKKHGEVFTPLYLVDEMINKVDDSRYEEISETLDLCGGYGQFTIRLIRKYYSIHGESFDLDLFFENHWINELQKSSAYKLLYIFGNKLNLAMGDALHLGELPNSARGVYQYSSSAKKWKSKNPMAKGKDLSYFKRQFQKFDGE